MNFCSKMNFKFMYTFVCVPHPVYSNEAVQQILLQDFSFALKVQRILEDTPMYLCAMST